MTIPGAVILLAVVLLALIPSADDREYARTWEKARRDIELSIAEQRLNAEIKHLEGLGPSLTPERAELLQRALQARRTYFGY